MCPKFGEFMDQWLLTKQDGKGNKRFMTLRALRRHLCDLDDMRLNEIKPKHICNALHSKSITPGAKFRAVQCFNQAMKYAINYGLIDSNPCAALNSHSEGIFKKPPVIGFKSVMPENLHAEFFARLAPLSPRIKLILLYITLSCSRLGEATHLQWSWIDFKSKVITVPAERMKMRRNHTIPLTPQLEQVIKAYAALYPKRSDYVFYSPLHSNKPVTYSEVQTPIRTLCKEISTIHGLRKTARTWFAQQSIPFELAEYSLAHEEKSTVVRAYQKYDYLEERREVLAQWDSFVLDNMPASFMEPLSLKG